MSAVVPFPQTRSQGAISRSLARSASTFPKVYVVDPNAARAFITRIRANHHRSCPCYGVATYCCILEKKIRTGLDTLSAGGTVADALDAAGPFGVRGSVEVLQ